MAGKSAYFKTGVFILSGIVLLTAGLIVLGAGKFFQQSTKMETYVNESINGLEVGSALKYRGVKIGRVSHIGFVTNSYVEMEDSDYRYIRVVCELDQRYLGVDSYQQLRNVTRKEVKSGMRVRPTTQGLTGQLFMEIDYLDPKQNPPLPINWDPKYVYIPSAPSTLSMVEAAISSISKTMQGIKGSDVGGAIRELRKTAETLTKFLDKANVAELSKELAANFEESRKLIARVNHLISTPEAETVIPNAAGTVAEVRKLLEQSRPNIVAGVKDIREAAGDIGKIAQRFEDYFDSPEGREAVQSIGPAMGNVTQASQDIRSSAAKLNAVMSRVDNLVAGQQLNIQAVMENLRLLLDNLKEISDEARRYPSGVLFGQPPGKAQPEERRP
jgi:paraquat-inducible protein B